ncbi:MAG TPA: YHS domain-containing protein [Planctomycetaceae bacterium]|nr:YHS domain-containing protein [Planctomycetaceae bacterium]
MEKRLALATIVSAAVLATVSFGRADDGKVNLKGIKCLICNMQVSEDISTDYKGAKLYFGCNGCPARFKANVDKYAAKANAQLVASKQAKQKACPLSGRPCKKQISMKVADTTVYFCCNGCKRRVAKLKGDAQVEKVFGDVAFEKGFEIPKKKK